MFWSGRIGRRRDQSDLPDNAEVAGSIPAGTKKLRHSPSNSKESSRPSWTNRNRDSRRAVKVVEKRALELKPPGYSKSLVTAERFGHEQVRARCDDDLCRRLK